MQIHLTFEGATKSTVGFADDGAGHPDYRPGVPVIGTFPLRAFAWAQLGNPELLAVSVEAVEPMGAL